MTTYGRQTREIDRLNQVQGRGSATPDVSRTPEAFGEATTNQAVDPLAARIAYSVAEASLVTGLSRDLLYEQMRRGKLPYLKIGRRRLITRRNLEAFLVDTSS